METGAASVRFDVRTDSQGRGLLTMEQREEIHAVVPALRSLSLEIKPIGAQAGNLGAWTQPNVRTAADGRMV
jgi:hypothetical protein